LALFAVTLKDLVWSGLKHWGAGGKGSMRQTGPSWRLAPTKFVVTIVNMTSDLFKLGQIGKAKFCRVTAVT